ncbi:hypothetical protein HYV12_03125 [Candidatus Dojkabacteria bacterium]|nr:hypothetical protein [Candidatus Dojkabacteria bacterium]
MNKQTLERELAATALVDGKDIHDYDGLTIVSNNQERVPITHRVVEVGGSLKAGKTSLIMSVRTKFYPALNFVPEDPKSAIEKAGTSPYAVEMTEHYKDFQILEVLSTISEIDEQILPPSPVICERSLIDHIVWKRTLMILGLADFPEMGLNLEHTLSLLHPDEVDWSFIMLLNQPQTYFQRGGHSFDIEFLEALNKQYMRLAEEINDTRPKLNFLCLDTSGEFEPYISTFKNAVQMLIFNH